MSKNRRRTKSKDGLKHWMAFDAHTNQILVTVIFFPSGDTDVTVLNEITGAQKERAAYQLREVFPDLDTDSRYAFLFNRPDGQKSLARELL